MQLFKLLKSFFFLLSTLGKKKANTIPVEYKEPIQEYDCASDLVEDEIKAVEQKHEQKYLWVLGAGHGKNTNGKRSPKENGNVLLFEWQFNREIVKLIKERLDELGIANVLLVDDTFTDNFYKKRIKRLEAIKKESQLPVMYLSIHGNAHGNGRDWTSAKGIETWYQTRNRKSRKLASIVQRNLMLKCGKIFLDRGIRSKYPLRKSFYVLRMPLMHKITSLVLELGFYTNKKECENMLNEDVRKKMAWSIVDSILQCETTNWETVEDYKLDREITVKPRA